MIEFAQHEFRLNKRDKDGVTLRETLATVERMTGRKPQEAINPAEFPSALGELWLWFLELNAARATGMGPSPITYPDMQAYFNLMQCSPEPWQIQVIKRLDRVALDSA